MRKVEGSWSGVVLVCTHQRDPDASKASCGTPRGTELREWLKARFKKDGLKGEFLIAKSGCLDVCSPLGVTVAAMPPLDSGIPRTMLVVEDTDDREAVYRRLVSALRTGDTDR